MSDFWIGTFPDWLVGIGTLALAALTFVGLIRERAEKRRLQDQVRQQAEAEVQRRSEESERSAARARRAQAEQIAVWADLVDRDGTSYFDATDVGITEGEAAIVRNDSRLPISDIRIAWCKLGGRDVLAVRPIPSIPPRAHRTFMRPRSLKGMDFLPLEVDFTDAHGVVWRLDREGQLQELGQKKAFHLE